MALPQSAFPAFIDPVLVSQLLTMGQSARVSSGGFDYTVVGVAHQDEGGSSFQPQLIAVYPAGTYNVPNAQRAEYDLNGNFSRMSANMNGGSYSPSDFKDAFEAIATVGAMYAVGAGLAAAGAGSAAGIGGSGIGAAEGTTVAAAGATGEVAADASLAVQGNSINALDAATGVGYGSEAGAWTIGTTVAAAPTVSLGSAGSLLSGIKSVLGGAAALGGVGAAAGRSAPAPTPSISRSTTPGAPRYAGQPQQQQPAPAGGLSLTLILGAGLLAALAFH